MSAKTKLTPPAVAAEPPELVAERDGAQSLRAELVAERDGAESLYGMFRVGDVNREAAFLVGDVLLEVDEALSLRLSLGDASARVRARVTQVKRGRQPGIAIAFEDWEDDAAALRDWIDNHDAGTTGDS